MVCYLVGPDSDTLCLPRTSISSPHLRCDQQYAGFKPVRGTTCARKAIQKYFGTKNEDPFIRAASADVVHLMRSFLVICNQTIFC